MLVKHLLHDLFPKCDGSDSDIVVRIMREYDLESRDRSGEIYATVRYFKIVCQ